MRRLMHIGLAAVVAIPALSCSSMTVRADHDSQHDFSVYSTFAIFERQGKEPRQPQMSPIVDRRIAATMASELEARGLEPTSPGRADFLKNHSIT